MTKNDKKVRIACQGAATIKIDDLQDFQGGLKTLSDGSYQKLRGLILKLGFSFPVAAWKNKGKTYILDAHQRVTTLKRMRDEDGFTIPPLPVNWIEAGTRKEAAEKLLAATSQFGEVTNQGLFEFMQEFKLDMTSMAAQFEFPEIDLERFNKTFFPVTEEVSFTRTQKPSKDDSEEESDGKTCPKCGFELS